LKCARRKFSKRELKELNRGGFRVLSSLFQNFIFPTLIFLILTPFSAHTVSAAEGDFMGVGKKQEEKRKTQWSLSEWLETKDRMMLMDLWLAVHTPSPYEFYLSADYDMRSPVSDSAAATTGYRATFGAFASIFGLEVERDSVLSRWNLLFKLRLAGFHNQGTNLTAFAGGRIQSQPEHFWSPMIGASLVVYFTRFFGAEGQARYYLPSNSPGLSFSYRGTQMEGSAFIDFNFLRIYGGYMRYFDDSLNQFGYQFGTRIFF
jgi:hypothetical protein